MSEKNENKLLSGKVRVVVKFTRPILGTIPADSKSLKYFISEIVKKQELESVFSKIVDHVKEKYKDIDISKLTIFRRVKRGDKLVPIITGYMIKSNLQDIAYIVGGPRLSAVVGVGIEIEPFEIVFWKKYDENKKEVSEIVTEEDITIIQSYVRGKYGTTDKYHEAIQPPVYASFIIKYSPILLKPNVLLQLLQHGEFKGIGARSKTHGKYQVVLFEQLE